jgi:thiol-disulfide isomerase/thioredoxin
LPTHAGQLENPDMTDTTRRLRGAPAAALPHTFAIVVALAAAACTGAASPAPSAASPTARVSAMPTHGPVASPDLIASGEPMASGSPAAASTLTQAWATAELTDVRTGEAFRIADLAAAGKVVFIETMAIWCTNCRSQQGDVVSALEGLDAASVQWIGVDVDRGESPSALAAYSRQYGFDWPYVVASDDLSRALAADFGDQVLNPPSTPIVVVAPDGRVFLTEFGHKSVDRIRELAAAYGA